MEGQEDFGKQCQRFFQRLICCLLPEEEHAKDLIRQLGSSDVTIEEFIEDLPNEELMVSGVVRSSEPVVTEICSDGELIVLEPVTTTEASPGLDETPVIGKARRKRVRHKKPREDFGVVLANEAYFHFGRRRRDEANDLVTRKWLRNYCRDNCKDLRAADMNAAIGIALVLSYVPPIEELRAERAATTRYFRSRLRTNDERCDLRRMWNPEGETNDTFAWLKKWFEPSERINSQ